MKSRLKVLIPVGAGIVIILILLASSIKIIDQTEIAVVRTLGEITGTLESGIHLVNPLTQKIALYDTKIHVKELTFESYTKDAQAISAQVEVQYELPKTNVEDVAKTYGSYDALETKLSNVVEEKTKVVISRLSAMTLMETRSQLSASAIEEMHQLETVFPVRFTSVIIKDISFSDAFEAVIEQKMAAEQEALRAQNVTKQLEEENKQKVAAAVAEAEALKASADAAAYETRVKAEAEAEAMRLIQEQLSKDPLYIDYIKWSAWNGVLPETVLGSSGVIIDLP